MSFEEFQVGGRDRNGEYEASVEVRGNLVTVSQWTDGHEGRHTQQVELEVRSLAEVVRELIARGVLSLEELTK